MSQQNIARRALLCLQSPEDSALYVRLRALVGSPGLEPGLTESESAVLPIELQASDFCFGRTYRI